MDEKTPIKHNKHNDLRRKSMMNNARKSILLGEIGVSPLRRSIGNTSSASTNVTPSLVVTNDEEERSQRQNDIALQKRLSNISTDKSIAKSFDESELKEHLLRCLNLFADNKISTKNVWSLHIIDALEQIIAKDNEENILKLASSSLDASVKVYSLKVDDVHSHVLKLANNLGNVKDKKRAGNDDDDDDNDKENAPENSEEIPGAVKEKPKKRKKRFFGEKKTTVDYEGTSLFGPLPKINMVPFSSGEDVELSAIDNLFTVKLPMHPLGHTTRILDKQLHRISEEDETVTKRSKVKIDLPLLKEKKKICGILDDFIVNEWDLEREQQFLAEHSKMSLHNDIVLDNNGLPVAELDGSIHDIFADDAAAGPSDNADDFVEEFIEGHEGVLRNEIDAIADAIPEDCCVETEYGYNRLLTTASGRVLDKLWAGPAHWKLKYIRSNEMRYTGVNEQNQQQQQPAKAKRKKPVEQCIDWAKVDIDMDQKLVKKKKNKSNNAVDKYAMPESVPINEESNLMVQRLLLKEEMILEMKSKNLQNNFKVDNVETYKYDNPNDSQYCPENICDDNDDNHDGGDDDVNHDEPVQNDDCVDIIHENMCGGPEPIKPVMPKYAMHAKKLNMKRLKTTAWEFLTKKPEEENKKAPVVPMKFSEVFSDLPKFLSQQMRSELSPAITFSAILYLAHEHNLVLKSDIDLKDFTINN